MPDMILVTEKYESRRFLASRDGKASTMTLVLTVSGSMDPYAVKNAATGFAPPTQGAGFPLLWKQQVEVNCIGTDGGGIWEAQVRYDTSAPEPLSANDSFSFEISGGTQHITQALITSRYPASLPDQFGAIGVTDDGVTGADVYAPETTFEETHWFQEISPAYKGTLINIRGRLNSNAFRGLSPGEVLFEGVSARKMDSRFETPWSITYRFRVSRNALVSIGGFSDIEKGGFDLLDIRYDASVDGGTNQMVRRPVGVYVHTVYEYADFAALLIG